MSGERAVVTVGSRLLAKSAAPAVALVLGGWSALGTPLAAQQLPIRHFTAADGLAHDQILRVAPDARGYLWFATYDGLSRFDGRRFVSYGPREGLRIPRLNDLLQTRNGQYWLAASGGALVRYDPEASEGSGASGRFTTYPLAGRADAITQHLFEDRTGDLWIGTQIGLFRLAGADPAATPERVPLGLDIPDAEIDVVTSVEDPAGRLWIGTERGLHVRSPDGTTASIALRGVGGPDRVLALHADPDGRLWIGHLEGLFTLQTPTAGAAVVSVVTPALSCAQAGAAAPLRLEAPAGIACRVTGSEELFAAGARGFLRQEGDLWIGAARGLYRLGRDGVERFDAAAGIGDRLTTLAVDSLGNLWLGGEAGALRVARAGLRTYSTAHGLATPETLALFETNAGELVALTSGWNLNRFDGTRFLAVRPGLPAGILAAPASARREILQDHQGEWWASTREGLYRFPAVARVEELARAAPMARYTTRDGLADDNISRLFEDSSGDLWIGTFTPPVMLTRWQRASGRFDRFDAASGHPADNWTNVFAESPAGRLWIGLHNGGLMRRTGDRFETFGAEIGLPPGLTQGLYFDRDGALWVATSAGGAARIRDPEAARPRAETVSAVDGLSSNNLRAFVEDDHGDLWFGTARSVDRRERATGRVESYGVADGLAGSEVTAALRDRTGRLWFGTRRGVSSLRPERLATVAPGAVWIAELEIAGRPWRLHDLGDIEVGPLELAPHERRLEIAYAAFDFAPGGGIRYQTRVAGASDEWSAPTESRTAELTLAPGTYRFEVRAVNARGELSPAPASVTFRILAPLWQRAWFVTLVVALAAALGTAVYRARVARLVAVERVRTAIAADLHDDLGSSLGRISLLSEVAATRTGSAEASSLMRQIGETARELSEATSDIVWAIDPRRDDLESLLVRLRRYASDLFEARGVRLTVDLPAELGGLALAPVVRRDLYLLLKESLHNVAKHAEASSVGIAVRIAGGRLVARVEDDGRGFDPALAASGSSASLGGHGLGSLRTRAARLGGELTVDSAPGRGTRIVLDIPLSSRRVSRSRAARRVR